MSPTSWVRDHPSAVVVAAILFGALILARLLPLSGVAMLSNENVIQILGVIIAGQLAVLALTVPATLELRASVSESDLASELGEGVDLIMNELKSNTLWSFLMLGLTFALSIFFEAMPSVLSTSLPFGFDVGMLFSATKVSFVVMSCLAMWDCVEPLFGISVAMTELKRMRSSSSKREQ